MAVNVAMAGLDLSAAHKSLKFSRFAGFRQSFRQIDVSMSDEICQSFLQGLHALFTAGLDLRIELGGLAFADEVGDRRGVDHDFLRQHPAELARFWIAATAERL